MAIQVQGNSGVVTEVDDTSTRALRTVVKPVGYGSLGHYRATINVLSVAAQVAGARILVLRNNAANLIIPTRLTMRAIQVAAGTAQENAIDVFKLTGFTVLDTTNTTTPVAEVKRVSGMAAAPGGAQLRASNAAAGMTGGTSVTGTAALGSLPYNVAAAINTSSIWGPTEVFDDVNGTHPLVLAQNEGLVVANRTLNVTSYGIRWYFDLAWVETTAY
jgi:hypothetical protein